MDSDLNHKVSSCAQNVVINDTKSIRSLGTSKIIQGLVVGPLLFKLFKFAGDTKLGRVADMPKGCGAIQTDFTWPMNLVKFNKRKHWVLALGRINPMHQYMLVADCLESKWEEKDQAGPSGHVEHDINVPCGKGGQQALGLH